MNRFELINSIVDDPNLTLSEKALLVALWRFSDTSGYSFPSVETLMTASSIGSKNTFIKARKSLVEKGYIQYITHKNKPCEYYIKIGSSELSQYKNDSADLSSTSAKVIQFGGSKLSNEQTIKHNKEQNNNSNIASLVAKMNQEEYRYFYGGGWMMEMSSEFIC